MKAKIIAVLFLLFISFFAVKVHAQDLSSIMSQNKIRTCLTGKVYTSKKANRDCRRGTKDPKTGEFRGGDKDCEKTVTVEDMSKIRITGTCEAPNGCEIWQYNNGKNSGKAQMKKVISSVPVGAINRDLKGTFTGHDNYAWYAIGDAPVVIGGLAGAGVEAENQTQQVGQVSNFEFPQTEGSDQKCSTIFWDPFGRVFDAVSLEPISDIQVSLFQNDSKQLVSLPTNPAITDKRGVYNILVDKEDFYYLNVAPGAIHSFTQKVQLNPNYEKIYSHIYSTPGEVFFEASLPAVIPEDFDFGSYHFDIPLQPKGKPYTGAVAEVVEGSLNQADFNDFVTYSGQVTFPMAQICLVGETSGVLACIEADKYGNFNVSVDKLSIPQEFIEIKVEKVDLTELSKVSILNLLMALFVKPVNAQTSIRIEPPTPTLKPIGFNPILSYIEGYAYDQSGEVVPNARITVKLKANNEVFYQTTADETGFFAAYSNNLPFFEYYLEITNPVVGTPVKQTTSEFVALNQDYITSEDLDLIKSTRAGEPIINPETGRENIILSTPTPIVTAQPTTAKPGNQMIALVFVLLFLIVAVAAALFYVVKKRQSIS